MIKQEPYTAVVTYSSKVGSDQKEINISLSRLSDQLIETDESVNVMDSAYIEGLEPNQIGGLRFFLNRVYREITGEDAPPTDTSRMKSMVFDLLKNERHQVLMVIDNFEDIEDNIDDEFVREIRENFIQFFNEFKQLEDTKSRIIITTRSNPLDVAHGIP